MTGSSSAPNAIIRAVDDDSARWGIARPIAWTLLIVPLLFMTAMMVVGVASSSLFHWFMDEDHIVEWVQFGAILIASIAFAIAAIRAGRAGRNGLAAIYLVVAVGAFLAAGEEISWGQRLLGFTTPEALEDINHQAESNLHNISAVQRLFNLGEMLAGLYGLLLPLLWLAPAFKTRVARWLDPLLVPPLCLVVLFFLPFAYRAIRFAFLPDAGERITELGEVPELTFYLGVMVMGIVTTGVLGRRAGASQGPSGQEPADQGPTV